MYSVTVSLSFGKNIMEFDIFTISEWYIKRINLINLINKFDWENKRDFNTLINNVDQIVKVWDNAKIEQRSRKTTASDIKVKKAEDDFLNVIKLLKQQILISKLYK